MTGAVSGVGVAKIISGHARADQRASTKNNKNTYGKNIRKAGVHGSLQKS